MKTYYYKTTSGEVVNVDDMNVEHLRESLKTLLKAIEEGKLIKSNNK